MVRERWRAVRTALVVSFLVAAVSNPAAGAPSVPCAVEAVGTKALIRIPATRMVSTVSVQDGSIAVDGVVCGPASLESISHINVTDEALRSSTLKLDLSGESFAAPGNRVTWDLDLGDGSDAVVVSGGAGKDVMTLGRAGLRLVDPSGETADVVATGVDRWTLAGGSGDDVITGGTQVFAGEGNDTISGDDGTNVIWAGGGDDLVYGRGGDDELQGNEGNDTLYGGTGDDQLNGGYGNDAEYGGDNNDVFMESAQRSFSSSGGAVAIPDGGTAVSPISVPSDPYPSFDTNARIYVDHPDTTQLSVTLIAPNGKRARLSERRGNGTPFTGTQFDSEAFTNIRYAGSKNFEGRFHPEWSMEPMAFANPAGTWKLEVIDRVAGGTGSIESWSVEFMYAEGTGNGQDVIRGGTGTYDLVDYAARLSPVTVTMRTGADDGQVGETDDVGSDTEALYGGQSDDALSGTDVRNDLRGLSGHDTIYGFAGNDQIRGGNNRDTIYAGDGNDAIYGHANGDAMDGGTGTDRVFFDYSPVGMIVDLTAGTATDGAAGNDDDTLTEIENVTGSNAADRLVGNDLGNSLSALGGSDSLDGRGGTDVLNGGPGTDTCVNGESVTSCEG